MDRRDVLKLGAVASLSGSSCAALLSNPGAVTGSDLPGFLQALDESMGKVANGDFFAKLLGPNPSAAVTEKARASEELTKKTMRSLLLVGTLSELPQEQLAHEDVQRRLQDSMGEFDDAMFGMARMLENLSDTERADLGRTLRENPDLGMRIMGDVDQEAAAFGVSMKQRVKLRTVSMEATTRLKNSTDLTISDCVAKMQKIGVRHGALAEAERGASAAIAQQLLWQADSSGGALSPPPPPPPTPAAEPTNEPPPVGEAPEQKRRMRASHVVLTAGGIALGLGLAIFGIGYAAGGSAGILLGVTFGVLFGVIGLITLLVGLILLAAGK
ncbi:MAG: hypothetical protein U0228_31030 [Myxococcaceae bacterium]